MNSQLLPLPISPSPPHPSHRRTTPLCCLLLALCPALARGAEEPPVEFQPEQVTIAIRFADSPELLPDDRNRIGREIQDIIRRLIGTRWVVRHAKDASFVPRSLADLDVFDIPIDRGELSEESPRPSPLETAPEKYFALAIQPDGPGFEVALREWDRLTDSLGPVASRFANSREEIAQAAAAALVDSYRPVAKIEEREGTPLLHIRGGGLPTPDRGLLAPAPGTLFRAVLLRRDREGRLVEVRPVPYTFLELQESHEGVARVTSHSALRSALGPRRGLVTAWAIAAPPMGDATRLTLLRETDGVPLAGRRVEIRAEPFQPTLEQQPEPIHELLTDRTGAATIPRDADQPLVWATIKSGTATLMRIPIAPGADSEIELRLGDDQRRLDTEGRIAVLTGELIEIVAKRAALLVKARREARGGNFDEARAALDAAAGLDAAEEFHRRLAAIAIPAANAAEEAGDRQTAARIRALAGKTGDLIDRYLKTEPIRVAREEVEELEAATKGE